MRFGPHEIGQTKWWTHINFLATLAATRYLIFAISISVCRREKSGDLKSTRWKGKNKRFIAHHIRGRDHLVIIALYNLFRCRTRGRSWCPHEGVTCDLALFPLLFRCQRSEAPTPTSPLLLALACNPYLTLIFVPLANQEEKCLI